MSFAGRVSRKGKIGWITCNPEVLDSIYSPEVLRDMYRFTPDENGIIKRKDPHFTPDDQIAVDELRERGYEVVPVEWGKDVSEIKREGFNLLLNRSPWDNMDSEALKTEFFEWFEELKHRGIKVQNPVDITLWSYDKHYFHDMEGAGVEMVPSAFLDQGMQANLVDMVREKGAFIVKPTVSAGGIDIHLIQNEEEAREFQQKFNELIDTQAVMIQPFLEEIREKGEWSIMFINGEPSFSLLKKPGQDDFRVQETYGGTMEQETAPAEIMEKAEEIYKKIGQAYNKAHGTPGKENPLLYARVDIVPTKEGLRCMEIDIGDAGLFFSEKPESAMQFCDGVEALVSHGRTK